MISCASKADGKVCVQPWQKKRHILQAFQENKPPNGLSC